jgi:hypothetical protein
MKPSTLDQRICPGCGRRPRRVHACAHCQWTADPSKIPTVRELLDGTADGYCADGDTKGHRVRAACGGRIRPHDVQMSDLPPSCETCRETRLWRAIEQWEPDDEAE